MRRVSAFALVAAVLAAPAFAALTEIDTDGDGFASFDELVAAYPGLEIGTFEAIDLDEDGMVNEQEMTAAIDANLLVAAEPVAE